MKKKIQQVTPEIQKTNINLLEQCATAFIKEALISNLSKEDALKIIRKNWFSVYIDVYPLSEESPEEKEFRKKAITFLEKNKQAISSYVNSFPYSNRITVMLREKSRNKKKQAGNDFSYIWDCMEEYYNIPISIDTSIFLEVLCAFYKVFSNFEHFDINNVASTTCDRLDKIYIQYFNQQRTYVKMVVNWFIKYLSTLEKSCECASFINEYECNSSFEKEVCHLIFIIENC